MTDKNDTSCARHKWRWVKNVIVKRERGFMLSILKRGRYVCEKCGAARLGPMRNGVAP